MEREILFRGKRIDNGEWVEGNYIFEDFDRVGIHQIGTIIQCFVIPETVGQFTGLLDKNGNKIFEGDILKAGNGHIGYADFSEGGFVLVCRCHSNFADLYGAIQEVIGNIHDNPELLKDDNILSEKRKEFYGKKKAITERLRKDNEDFEK